MPIISSPLIFRRAEHADVPALVQLLADDPLGSQREMPTNPLPDSYYQAFTAIDSDSNNELVVAILDNVIVGMLQITYIPYLTHQGSWRALIEGVRVGAEYRSMGFGSLLFEWAIRRASDRHCRMLQLTSDKLRTDAIRFYESLGFTATHEGFKMALPRERGSVGAV